MTILQRNMRLCLLMSSTAVQLLTTPEREGDMVEMTDAEASMSFSEEVKRPMEALTKAKTWFTIYTAPTIATLNSSAMPVPEKN